VPLVSMLQEQPAQVALAADSAEEVLAETTTKDTPRLEELEPSFAAGPNDEQQDEGVLDKDERKRLKKARMKDLRRQKAVARIIDGK